MTLADARSLQRVAQRLVVEVKPGFGSPPTFGPDWEPVWGAKVGPITINRDGKPSEATIWFPELRWDESSRLLWGDMIRIRTDEPLAGDRTVLFVGFITRYRSSFSGGTEKLKGHEQNMITCQSYRWLLAVSSPIFGQIARGPDDYLFYGTPGQMTKNNSWTFLTGQRAIFNANGRPNSDPFWLDLYDNANVKLCDIPIFANPSDNPDMAVHWTARDMIRYILCPIWNKAYEYLPIDDPNKITGLDHGDWDKVLNHIVVEGLNVVEAIELVCKHLGWGFREDYTNYDIVELVFYKIAAADGYTRNDDNPTVLHRLYAPPVGESVDAPVTAGEKLLWSMELDEDIAAIVNNPWGLGAPDRFEFTTELVPAWLDNNLEPDTSEDNANLFFTEAELQELAEDSDPNSKSYYRYYHPRGSGFRHNVGRKWVMNESGLYSRAPYYRGMPFDFSTIVPPEYVLDSQGKRLFAPFNRQLLPCLTLEEDSLSSIGIRVEFSFNGGQIWQVIPASIRLLKGECGIYISEANLAELVDAEEVEWTEGTFAGVQLNYWTSLCRDKLEGNSFKNGEWMTRVRVTASIQMDQRVCLESHPSSASGSPFWQSQVYDFSEKYGLVERTAASIFAGLPVFEHNLEWLLQRHLDGIRKANEDMSISGLFTLERLWLGDGVGAPDFMIGDCIERITGREYELSASFGGGVVYPEIVQIIYLPDKQKMQLVTRDLRFAQVLI